MFKSLLTACLIGVGILGMGAIGGQRPGDASGRLLVAFQDERTKPHDAMPGPELAKSGWIGVSLEDKQGNGVRIRAVFPAGPAAFAGVRVGDSLVKIGGANVDSINAAQAAIERLSPHKVATLTVLRQGKAVELKVTPDRLAEFREHYVGEMLRRDPRDARYGQQHGVSEADMSIELVRRLFEQHQRMETSLNELRAEISALRQEVRALKK